MNKRLPILLSLLGMIVLAASIAYWILQLYQPPQRPLAAVPHAQMPDPPVDAAATLFGGQLAVASATNYQLTGVISSGGDSVAILVAEGAPPKALRVGREISPGVKLAEVHARYVMLSDGGALKRVDLAPDTKPAAPMGGAPGNAGMAPPPINAPIAMPPGGQMNPQMQAAPPPATQTVAAPDQNTQEPPMSPGAVQGQQQGEPPPANPNSAPARTGGAPVMQNNNPTQ